MTEDLGGGWFGTANEDGSCTLRNPDRGQRIDLSRSSVALWVELWERAEAAAAERKMVNEEA